MVDPNDRGILTEATMPAAAFTAAFVTTLKEIDDEYLSIEREDESVVNLFLSILDREICLQLQNLEEEKFQVTASVKARAKRIVPTLRASMQKKLTPEVLREIVEAGGLLFP